MLGSFSACTTLSCPVCDDAQAPATDLGEVVERLNQTNITLGAINTSIGGVGAEIDSLEAAEIAKTEKLIRSLMRWNDDQVKFHLDMLAELSKANNRQAEYRDTFEKESATHLSISQEIFHSIAGLRSALDRIAFAIENAVQPESKSSPNNYLPLIGSALGAVIAGLIGYFSARTATKRQERRAKAAADRKGTMILKLMDDELKNRWLNKLRCMIANSHTLNESDTEYDALRKFSRDIYGPEDLFVIKQLSESFANYEFMEDDELLRKTIVSYKIFRDFLDFKQRVERFVGEYDVKRREQVDSYGGDDAITTDEKNTVRRGLVREYGDRIKTHYRSFSNLKKYLDESLEATISHVDKSLRAKGETPFPRK